MADCEQAKPCRCLKSKWAIAILVITLLCLIGYIVWKGYVMTQQSRLVGFLSLNGYWHISDNRYLMIKESLMQIVDMEADGTKELFKIKSAKIDCVDTSVSAHAFKVDNYTAEVNQLGIDGPIQILVIPSVGIMQFENVKGKIAERLIKDNELTVASIMA